MSAYVVNDFHINALAAWAEDHRVTAYWGGLDIAPEQYCFYDNAPTLAGVLATANTESVNQRYDEDDFSHFKYKREWVDLSPVQVLKAVSGLEYQCVHLEWESTLACALLNAIRSEAIRCLDGYSDAAWELHPVGAKNIF